MNIVICDITGRTINYDVALCDAINKELSSGDKVELWSAGLKDKYQFKSHVFFSLVPRKYRSISHPATRMLKTVDTLISYVWIALQLVLRNINVLHIQWFPFISLGTTGAGIDLFFIRLFKKVSPKTQLVFTIHNMCPHSMKDEDRQKYNPTFSRALQLFDKYVVHTERTKEEVIDTFDIAAKDIYVIYHGIFTARDFEFTPIDLSKNTINIIMYGSQNPYKGTDIFVEGLKYISEELKRKVHVTICGVFERGYLDKCKSVDTGVRIEWIPRFVTDNELYEQINKADLIILPYRRISQSGVLLLALSTKRLVLTSKLPTFVETLKGFDKDSFFESENPQALAKTIEAYIDGTISKRDTLQAIDELNTLYSWKESAKKTLLMYNSTCFTSLAT